MKNIRSNVMSICSNNRIREDPNTYVDLLLENVKVYYSSLTEKERKVFMRRLDGRYLYLGNIIKKVEGIEDERLYQSNQL